jgi:hypothetical protein
MLEDGSEKIKRILFAFIEAIIQPENTSLYGTTFKNKYYEESIFT